MKSDKKIDMSGARRKGMHIGAIFMALFLGLGMNPPLYGESPPIPTFGNGSVAVRLYTDYFCSPCRDVEPTIEPILMDLVKRDFIRLTFVDTPSGRTTVLYARYFLYALNQKKDFDQALLARRVLFGAAEEKIAAREALENRLTQKGIEFKPTDISPVFRFWEDRLNEDQIRSTPSCVIVNGKKKEIHVGTLEILKALEELKNKYESKP